MRNLSWGSSAQNNFNEFEDLYYYYYYHNNLLSMTACNLAGGYQSF